MGRIIYNPKEKKSKESKEKLVNLVQEPMQEPVQQQVKESYIEKAKFNNIRQIGDTDSEYKIYVEDYVYTYLYQYAAIDLTCEYSGVFLGKVYEETKEAIIWGIIPVSKDKLTFENEWINKSVIESIEEQKEEYFSGADCIGWMHMQPGYGTMLTMKEIKAQQEVFGNETKLLLLMDPINKIETFFVYEEETFKEQTGYAMYYERNEAMQRYMLEHPFVFEQKEVVEDAVVNHFRELGSKRKKQYQDKQKANFTVVAASLLILALTAVVVKMSDQGETIKVLQDNVQSMTKQEENEIGKDDKLKVVIETPAAEENKEDTDETLATASENLTVVDNTAEGDKNEPKEDNTEQVVQKEESIAKEVTEAKEEIVKKEESTEQNIEQVVQKEEGTDKKEEEIPYKNYVVQEGDTLLKISYDHYKTESKAKDIIKFNGLENGDKILVGQKIKIPTE